MRDLIERHDGRLLLLGEVAHEVLGRVLGREVVKLRSPDGNTHEISVADFNAFVSAGRTYDPSSGPHRLLTPAQRREQVFRRKVVVLAMQLGDEGYSWPDRIVEIKRRLHDDPVFTERHKAFPSERTVQKWQADWAKGGEAALAPRTSKCGNRNRRHDELFETLALDVIEEAYLPHDRMTITEITAQAQHRYLAACAERGIQPSPHGRKIVERIIESLPHSGVVKSRLGKRNARRRLLNAIRPIKVEAPLDRVELDCTIGDVHVANPEGDPVGRPTICAAVDAATGVILALQVKLGPPDAALVASVLKEIMTPKGEAFFARYGIENRLEANGRPQLIVVDQGSENSGELLQTVVRAAGLELNKCLPGHPEKKPFIERMFRDLNAFLQTLPGSAKTRLLPRQERTQVAMKEACYTLDELNAILQKWRYDSHAMLPKRRVQSALRTKEAPAVCWRRLAASGLVPEPPTPAELRQMFMLSIGYRRLHRYGIELHGLMYASDQLAAMWAKLGERQTVEVRYDPSDVREIAVFDPSTGVHFAVPCKDPDMPAISFAELKEYRRPTEALKRDELAARSVSYRLAAGTLAPAAQKPKTKLQQRKAKEIARQRRTEVIDRGRSSHLASMAHEDAAPAPLPALKIRRPNAPCPTSPRAI